MLKSVLTNGKSAHCYYKILTILLFYRYFGIMQHYGVNGYSLHAMNSLSAMYNLHQQAAQQAQHAPDYRPSVHALTLAERLAGKCVPSLPLP